MKRCFHLLSIIFFLAVKVDGQRVLIINDETQSVYLGKYLEYAPAKNGEEMPLHGYQQVVNTNISLAPDLVHWFKFTLDNQGQTDRSLLLYFHNAQIDTAQYFVFINDTLSYISPFTSCDVPAKKRPTLDRTLSIPISIISKTKQEIYFKIYGREFQLSTTPQLVDPLREDDFSWTTYLFLLLFVLDGLCILIIIVLAINIKKYQLSSGEALMFLTYGIAGLLYLIATSGYGSLYLWGNWPWFEVNAAIFFGAVSCFALLEFSRTVLNLSVHYPKIANFFFWVGRLYLTISVFGFFHYFSLPFEGFYKALITIPYLLTLICLVMIMAICNIEMKESKKTYFAWIAGFYFFHALFYLLILSLENNIIPYNYRYHSIINIVCYVPQMFLALIYLVLKFIGSVEEKTKKLQNFRKQILTEIHDTVGESLTKIKLSVYSLSLNQDLPLEVQEKIKKISKETRIADHNLRELYFSVNTFDERFEHLQLYFKEIAGTFWNESKMKLTFDIQQSLLNVSMDKIIKTQLLMMYKEINNNIAKHSNASEVFISFNLVDNLTFRLLVRDNGIGFDKSLTNPSSHGLSGLAYRAQLIGGELEIISKLGSGTTIILVGPLS